MKYLFIVCFILFFAYQFEVFIILFREFYKTFEDGSFAWADKLCTFEIVLQCVGPRVCNNSTLLFNINNINPTLI